MNMENKGLENKLKWKTRLLLWIHKNGLYEIFEWIIVVLFILIVVSLLSLLKGGSFWDNVDELKEFHVAIAVIIIFLKFIHGFLKKSKNELKSIVNNVNQKVYDNTKLIDKYLNAAKIVFESGINEFDDNHLLALQRILRILNSKEIELISNDKNISLNIYAIDNSDPRSWWSDTMTGYLALMANWKSMDNSLNRRSVHRIFVCKKNELLSPVFVKTVSLHALMGFKTYIITYPMYKKVLDEIRLANPSLEFPEKEVLIWTKSKSENGNLINTPVDISFKLDKLGHSKVWDYVKCYQSFWDINSDYNYRNQLIDKSTILDLDNFYKHKVNSAKIDIWFEFIAKEKTDDKRIPEKTNKWEELPNNYIKLIEVLISKMECCKDANEVKHINSNLPFGIEIKTLSCAICEKGNNCDHSINNGTNFDFTSATDIKEILKEYYEKLNYIK